MTGQIGVQEPATAAGAVGATAAFPAFSPRRSRRSMGRRWWLVLVGLCAAGVGLGAGAAMLTTPRANPATIAVTVLPAPVAAGPPGPPGAPGMGGPGAPPGAAPLAPGAAPSQLPPPPAADAAALAGQAFPPPPPGGLPSAGAPPFGGPGVPPGLAGARPGRIVSVDSDTLVIESLFGQQSVSLGAATRVEELVTRDRGALQPGQVVLVTPRGDAPDGEAASVQIVGAAGAPLPFFPPPGGPPAGPPGGPPGAPPFGDAAGASAFPPPGMPFPPLGAAGSAPPPPFPPPAAR